MTVADLAAALAEGGPWLLLAATWIVVGGAYMWALSAGHIVTPGQHDDLQNYMEGRLDDCHERLATMEEDRDYWRDMATRAINVGESAIGRHRNPDNGGGQ